jgi:thiamine biosynthesis lipoprotein
MGTIASLHVHLVGRDDELTAEAAADAAFAELGRLEAVFSTFRADSQISRVNRGELHLLDCDPEVVQVLDACTWLEHASQGAFRARRPGEATALDPAGFVKGWAAERAATKLDDAGLGHWYLSVGGDLLARGTRGDGQPWLVAVADPLQAGATVVTLPVVDAAVATSGTSERGHHLWDGRTDQAPNDLAAVTVTGPTLTWADALATTAFALGLEGVDWVSRFDGYEALAIHADGRLQASTSLASRLFAPTASTARRAG